MDGYQDGKQSMIKTAQTAPSIGQQEELTEPDWLQRWTPEVPDRWTGDRPHLKVGAGGCSGGCRSGQCSTGGAWWAWRRSSRHSAAAGRVQTACRPCAIRPQKEERKSRWESRIHWKMLRVRAILDKNIFLVKNYKWCKWCPILQSLFQKIAYKFPYWDWSATGN